jgi:hypothetical protein
MQILASDKGEVILPGSLCGMLGIRPGGSVDATVEDGRIVLTVPERLPYVGKIVEDAITGFPVLDFGPDVPVLTSEMVAEILADFP